MKQVKFYYNSQQKFDRNNDFICGMSQQFLIRSNKLESYTLMRSNDIIRGLSYDLPWYCFVQIMMWIMLKQYYINLKLGSYFHHDISLHIYREHFYLMKIENFQKLESKKDSNLIEKFKN